MMMVSCPVEYPKTCRPNEKSCTEVGEINPNSGAWCSTGGKQCYKEMVHCIVLNRTNLVLKIVRNVRQILS